MNGRTSNRGMRVDAHRTADAPALKEQPYVLLNDQPLQSEDEDLLGTRDVAEGIASMLVASRSSSPFVLALDAGWGMGKSTLLRQIETRLSRQQGFKNVNFNAWTAEGENALEGLIKTVLVELDPSFVRRWVRKIGRNKRTVGFARIGSVIVGRFLGIGRLVDELWNQMTIDSMARNELRTVINEMLSEWVTHDGKRDPNRTLAVFVDDLDRCSDEVVVKVCEAVKLYLDAPGLIFILACDQSVLAQGVSSLATGGAGEGRSYLEKIIQVTYRLPLPDESQIKTLISGYAKTSRTSKIIDDTVRNILAERTGRNPRKIKRIINSFVLEYRLEKTWQTSPLVSAHLVTAILLQHLYPSFYELLLGQEARRDFIGELLDYADVRGRALDPPKDADDPWWSIVRRLFSTLHMPAPDPQMVSSGTSEERRKLLAERFRLLEAALPENFQVLVHNDSLITLLREVLGDRYIRGAFLAQLIRHPLVTEGAHAKRVIGLLEQLAKLLTELFPNPEYLKRVLAESGINTALVVWTRADPQLSTFRAIRQAETEGRLRDLVLTAMKYSTKNAELDQIYSALG